MTTILGHPHGILTAPDGDGHILASAMQQLTPWQRCLCGHLWLHHDVEEYSGDGSETCCVEGCDQVGCPGVAT